MIFRKYDCMKCTSSKIIDSYVQKGRASWLSADLKIQQWGIHCSDGQALIDREYFGNLFINSHYIWTFDWCFSTGPLSTITIKVYTIHSIYILGTNKPNVWVWPQLCPICMRGIIHCSRVLLQRFRSSAAVGLPLQLVISQPVTSFSDLFIDH